MRHLQNHTPIRTSNAGQAHAHDRRAHQQHVEVVDGDRDLAELAVITACDKKDVEAFLQFFLSASYRDYRGSDVSRAQRLSLNSGSLITLTEAASCPNPTGTGIAETLNVCNPYWMQYLVRHCVFEQLGNGNKVGSSVST